MAAEPRQPEKAMDEVIRQDGRYPMEAYEFLHEAFEQAVRAAHDEAGDPAAVKHVTGKEFCEALRDLALKKWGPLAKTVLAKWNIRQTMDFGNMVYLLVNNHFMRKTEEDSIEHFRDVFAFDEAFEVEGDFELTE